MRKNIFAACPILNRDMIKELLQYNETKLLATLWNSDPEIYRILKSSQNRHIARDELFIHLNDIERHLFNIYSDKHFKDKNILERNNSKECLRILKNVIRSENERLAGFSALKVLYKAAKKKNVS